MWILETPEEGEVVVDVGRAVAELSVEFHAIIEADDYFTWEMSQRKAIISKRCNDHPLDYEKNGILNSVRRKHEILGVGKLVNVPISAGVSFRGSICARSIRLVTDSEPDKETAARLISLLQAHCKGVVSIRHLVNS